MLVQNVGSWRSWKRPPVRERGDTTPSKPSPLNPKSITTRSANSDHETELKTDISVEEWISIAAKKAMESPLVSEPGRLGW